jgi:hypothetical protein
VAPHPKPSPGPRTRPLCRDHGGDARSLELAASIERHQQEISRHEGAMLAEIAEYDRAEAWRGDGALSMQSWLTARCHVGSARARTLVAVAGKLDELPLLCAAFSEGDLTLDVLAPLAAVATSVMDAEWAPVAVHWSPKDARALAAKVRGTCDSEGARRFERRYVRFDDERCMVWAQLTKDAYALVKSALTSRARRHDHPTALSPDYASFESRCADALLTLCIEKGRRSGAGDFGGAQVTMVVHADLALLLSGDGYGLASIEGVGPISAEEARRLACNAQITVSFDGPDGACLDQKPLRREPTPAQRIEIRRRDNGCRFPGCPCKNTTDVHHVVWVSRQGPTVMSNLLTLCVAHHSRMHELGWKVDGDANGQVRFTSPHGRVFVSLPAPTWRGGGPTRK